METLFFTNLLYAMKWHAYLILRDPSSQKKAPLSVAVEGRQYLADPLALV